MKVAALVICLFAAACMRPAESLNTGAVDAAVAFTTRAPWSIRISLLLT
jgi:hypothetical protein